MLSIKELTRIKRQIKSFTEIDSRKLLTALTGDQHLFMRVADGLALPEKIDLLLDLFYRRLTAGNALSYLEAMPLLYLHLRLFGNDLFPDIRQVVVDEAQDYYPIHLYILKCLFPAARYTVMGDYNQTIEKRETEQFYQDAARILDKKSSCLLTLNKGFRSSYEINEFSRRLLPEGNQMESFERHEKSPVILQSKDLAEMAAQAAQQIAEYQKEGYASIGIICKSKSQAQSLYGVLRELNEKHGKTILVIEHHTEYIADYCKHVMLMRDGQVRWILPTENALQRVEELEECNIFPPQVTQAAHRLRRAGRLPADILLPTTVEGGKTAFAGLHYISRERPAPAVPDGESAVSFQDVSLAYRSVKGEPHTVFDGLNLNIRKGEKVALIGSNGAGKSTLMKLLVAALLPTTGSILVDGQPLTRVERQLKARLGYLPQDFGLFDELTVEQFLDYMAALKGLRSPQAAIRDVIRAVNLEEKARARIRTLSGGQRQRVGIAQALLGDPAFLIFDEPTVAVDPQSRNAILEGICRLRDEGATVVYTSHYMEEVEQICSRIMIMDGGRVLAQGTNDELKRMIQMGERVTVEVGAVEAATVERLRAHEHVLSVELSGGELVCTCEASPHNLVDILDTLRAADVALGRVWSEPPTLNDVFLEITGRELRD